MMVSLDGAEQDGEFIFGMVSNSISVGGFKSITRKGVEFDDGLFEGILIRTMKTPADLERVVRALLTGDVNERSMVSFRAHRVKFDAEDPVAWTCDGEFGGEYKETKIHIHRRAIDLLVVQDDEVEVIE